jgi:hypothetical protein
VLFVMSACVLAAVTLTRAQDQLSGFRARLGAAALPVVLAVASIALTLSLRPKPLGGLDPRISQALVGSAVTRYGLETLAAAILAAIGIAWWLRPAGEPSTSEPRDLPTRLVAPGLLGVSILTLLLLHGTHLVPTGAALPAPLRRPDAARVAIVNDTWSLFQAPEALYPPNTLALARIHELGGYDSLLHRDTVSLLRDINGTDPAPPENGNMMFVKSGADPRMLVAAGVSEVWSLREIPTMGVGERDGPFFRYSLPGASRAETPAGEATIVFDGYDRQVVRAVGPGRLVVRDRKMPGWSVRIGGHPAVLEGDVWREVELPPGEHDVEFTYRPPGLNLGFALSAGAMLVLYGLVGAPRRSRATRSEMA